MVKTMVMKAMNDFSSSLLCDNNTFYKAFKKDLKGTEHSILIESPFIATKRMAILAKHPDPYCTWPAVVAGPMPIRPRGKKSASRSTLEKVFGTRVVQTILEQEARFRSGWVA